MNAHLIRIVEGPLASETVAANDAVFELLRTPDLKLIRSLLGADVGDADRQAKHPMLDYELGGYAGI